MINLPNIRELDQISCIWKVFEGVATSGKVRVEWGAGVELVEKVPKT